ncbi:MAG: hypothetical protein IJF76_04350 [Clostridia bacterium]|nr:hypothetical protein [Clostridia bacterium]
MIKIRLHGLPEDVEKAKAKLKETFNVNSCSGNYADRGESKYVRAYLEVAFACGQSTDQSAEMAKAWDKSKKEKLI